MTNREEYPSAEGYVVYTCIYGIDQWEIQDPKMEVLYHLRHHETIYCGDIPLPSPYIGLIYGRYLRYLHQLWLSTGWLCQARSKTPKLWKRRRREAGRCWKGGIRVISHESFFFPYIGKNSSNWVICFRGVAQPPSRMCLIFAIVKRNKQIPGSSHCKLHPQRSSTGLPQAALEAPEPQGGSSSPGSLQDGARKPRVASGDL